VILPGAAVTSLLFAAVQIVPAYEYLRLSYKWFGDSMTRYPHIVPFQEFSRDSLSWVSLQSFVDLSKPVGTHDLTTLYIGLPALILVVVAFLKWKSPVFRFGILVSLAAFLIASGGDNLVGRVIYNIPILNLVRIPTRALHLWGFSAALLAALGMESIHSRARKKGIFISVLVIILFGGSTFFESYRFSQLLTFPTDSGLAPQTYYLENPAVENLKELNQNHSDPYRFMARPKELLPPNLGNVNNLRNINGHRSSMLSAYADFLSQESDLLSENFDMLGVKWVVSSQPVQGLRKLNEYRGQSIYERPSPLPIFWILSDSGGKSPAPINEITWGINSVSLKLGQHSGGWLVFSQPFYPGWKAIVDHQTHNISKFEIFSKIRINSGSQTITFNYLPWFFPLLGWLSLLVSLGVLVLIISDRLRTTSKR
jgi:hypothetical protein